MEKEPLEIGDYRNELGKMYSAINLFETNKEYWYKKEGLKEGDYPLQKIKPLRQFNQRYSHKDFVEIAIGKLGEINIADKLIRKINSQVKNNSPLGEIKENLEKLMKYL